MQTLLAISFLQLPMQTLLARSFLIRLGNVWSAGILPAHMQILLSTPQL
jgi:hypothetical protein